MICAMCVMQCVPLQERRHGQAQYCTQADVLFARAGHQGPVQQSCRLWSPWHSRASLVFQSLQQALGSTHVRHHGRQSSLTWDELMRCVLHAIASDLTGGLHTCMESGRVRSVLCILSSSGRRVSAYEGVAPGPWAVHPSSRAQRAKRKLVCSDVCKKLAQVTIKGRCSDGVGGDTCVFAPASPIVLIFCGFFSAIILIARSSEWLMKAALRSRFSEGCARSCVRATVCVCMFVCACG